jgi:RNA recognition motif-containing protein
MARKTKATTKAAADQDVEMGVVAMKVRKKVKKTTKDGKKKGPVKKVVIEGMDKPLRIKNMSPAERKKYEKSKAKLKKKFLKIRAEKKAKRERVICIRNLAFTVTQQSLMQTFGEAGAVESVELCKTPAGKFTGRAYVKYKTQEACDAACSKNGTVHEGREIIVERKGEKGPQPEKKTFVHDGTNKVCVRSLPPNTAVEVIRAHFAKCGEIKQLDVPTNSGGGCRGVAWVQYATEEAAQKARAELDGKALEGRKLTVKAYEIDRLARARSAGAATKRGKRGSKGKKERAVKQSVSKQAAKGKKEKA